MGGGHCCKHHLLGPWLVAQEASCLLCSTPSPVLRDVLFGERHMGIKSHTYYPPPPESRHISTRLSKTTSFLFEQSSCTQQTSGLGLVLQGWVDLITLDLPARVSVTC